MARYHFNIRNGHGYTADDEGMDLSSDDAARAYAITGARSLMSAEMLEGRLDLDGQIEVTDGEQEPVMTVRFAEAVDVHQATQTAVAHR